MSDAARSAESSSMWDQSRSLAKHITEQDRKRWSQLAWSVFKQMATVSNAVGNNTTLCAPQLLSALTLFTEVADVKTQRALKEQLFAAISPPSPIVPNTDILPEVIAVADYVALWVKDLAQKALPGSFHVARRLLVNVDYTKSYGFEAFSALNACSVDVKIAQEDVNTVLPEWMTRTLKLDDQHLNINPRVHPFQLWRKDEHRTKYAKCPILASVSRVTVLLQKNAVDDERCFSVIFQSAGAVPAWRIRGNQMAPLHAIPFGDGGELIQLPTAGDRLTLFVLTQSHSATDAKLGIFAHVDKFDAELVHRLIKGQHSSIVTLDSVFLPTFAVFPEQAVNLGAAIKQALPGIDSLFQPDGFGDLSFKGGEATASGSNTPSIQNWDYVGYMREREPQQGTSVRAEQAANLTTDRVVSRPFEMIVWDVQHRLPVYFSRITHPGKVPNWFANRTDFAKNNSSDKDKKK